MKGAVCWLVLALLGSGAGADEQTAEYLLGQAVETYAEAQSLTDHDARIAAFGRAAQLFEEARRQHPAGADLQANIGTAALQAERLGVAVLAFRRALAADPDHARARRNLAHARTLLPPWVPRADDDSVLDTFFFWHRTMSISERAGAGAVFFALTALLLAVAIHWRNRLARGLGLVFGAAWLALLASALAETYGDGPLQAVLTAEETVARAADSVNAPARFADPLPAGTEVEVVERRERWYRVRLANDREAWVPSQSLEIVTGSAGGGA